MSISRLPSGRWRAQVYDRASKRNISVSRVLGGAGTFRTKAEAKRAREKARERIEDVDPRQTTVREFWERWSTDPLFARPKESTDIRRREQTKRFVDRYGELPLREVATRSSRTGSPAVVAPRRSWVSPPCSTTRPRSRLVG